MQTEKEAGSCCWSSVGCSLPSHVFRVHMAKDSYWLQMESIDPALREGGETELLLFLCPPTLSPTSHTIKRNVSLCLFFC